jgi:hypothetical protein
MKSLDEARNVLRSGGSMVELAHAIGLLISDPTSSLEDLRLGLRYRGFIAEQAQMAIERRGVTSTGGAGNANGDSHLPSVHPQGTARQ